MTTIVYKDGVIAYDSRSSDGYTIVSDTYEKRHIENGVSFFLCGDTSGVRALVDAYFGGKCRQGGTVALVWDGVKLFHVTTEGKYRLRMSEVPLNGCYAIGSGRDHAYTAMDMGADAVRAVEVTKLRDCGTGGEVKFFKIR